MRIRTLLLSLLILAGATAPLPGCSPQNSGGDSIVVTYSILGSIVKELVGTKAQVMVLMPDGVDPHDWEPSARDIEKLNNAGLIVWNGLGLETGIESAVRTAASGGSTLFTAADHIQVRYVGAGEGIPGDDPDQQIGAPDPHFWVDPLAMKSVVAALAADINAALGIDVSASARDLENRLDDLSQSIATSISEITQADRKLVTGHESMGYFARRYGFDLIGAVIPNLSTQAEVSAADIAALVALIQTQQVKAIFTETGTSSMVAQTVADATGAKIVTLTTVKLPPDGSYFTFMSNLAGQVVEALK